MKPLFIQEIAKKMADAIKGAIEDGMNEAYIDHEAGDFFFTVETDENDTTKVTVINNETDRTDYPNVISAIRNAVPDWNDILDEVCEDCFETEERA